MRRILVDNARRKGSAKRGGDRERVDLEEYLTLNETPPSMVLALDEALDKLASEDPRKAELFKLRCFAGMSHQDAAAALGITRPTADRYWVYAKTHLYCEIFDPEEDTHV
jgi:RNA polymerase sigma factor (TIGR02999 family)